MTSREHTNPWDRRAVTAFALCASTLWACGEEPPVTSSGGTVDAIAAYEALSSQLEACEDEHTECVTAAANDPAQIASCDAALASCNRGTDPSDARARDALSRTADQCQDGDDAGVAVGDDDAGAGGGGGGRDCVERRVPNIPKCVRQFFACLSDAGVRQRSASREEIRACVQTGHMCFREELRAWRQWRREQNQGAAGSGGAGSGGQSAAEGGGGVGGADEEAAGSGGFGGDGDEVAGSGGFGGGGDEGVAGRSPTAGRGGEGGAGAGGSSGRGDRGGEDEECDWNQQSPFDRRGGHGGGKRGR